MNGMLMSKGDHSLSALKQTRTILHDDLSGSQLLLEAFKSCHKAATVHAEAHRVSVVLVGRA